MKKVLSAVCGVLLATVGAAHAASVTFAFDYVDSGQTGFVLERKLGTAGTYADQVTITTPAARQIVDSDVNTGQIYCWRLVAVGGAFRSAPSNEVCQGFLNTPVNFRIVPLP